MHNEGVHKLLAAAALAAVALAACGDPAPVTIRGTVTPQLSVRDAYGGFNCANRSPAPGTQVDVTDPSGKVIGTGTLGQWNRDTVNAGGVKVYRCDMPFTVSGVPAQQRYGFQVGGAGAVTWETDVSGDVSIDA